MIIGILKQATNYLFVVFSNTYVLDKLNKILTNYLMQIAILLILRQSVVIITAVVVIIIQLKLLFYHRVLPFYHFF